MSDEETTSPTVNPETEPTQTDSPKVAVKTVPAFLIVLILAQLAFSIYLYVDKENQIKNLNEEISSLRDGIIMVAEEMQNTLYEIKNPDIDLTAESYQPFSNSYGILIQEFEVLPNGKKIQGRIVNFDAVTVFEVDLTFKIGADSKDFIVDEIRPGGSRRFEVTVTGQDAALKDTAKVIWNGNKFY